MKEIYLTRLACDTRHVGVYKSLKVVNVLVLRHDHFHVSTSALVLRQRHRGLI